MAWNARGKLACDFVGDRVAPSGYVVQRWACCVKKHRMVAHRGILRKGTGGGTEVDHAQIHAHPAHHWAQGVMKAHMCVSRCCTGVAIAVSNA